MGVEVVKFCLKFSKHWGDPHPKILHFFGKLWRRATMPEMPEIFVGQSSETKKVAFS